MARSQIRFSSEASFVPGDASSTTATSARRRQAALNLTKQSQDLAAPGQKRSQIAKGALTVAALTSLAALLALWASQLGG